MSEENILSDVAMLVSLKITTCHFEKTDTDASDEFCANKKADSQSAKVVKKLFGGNQALKDLIKIAGRARNDSKKLTLPYRTGQDLLSVQMYEKHGELMNDYKDQFLLAKTVFIQDYKTEMQVQRVKQGKLWKASDYPHIDAVDDAFTFNLLYEPIADCQSFDKMGLGKLVSDATNILNDRITDAVMKMFKDIEKYLGNFALRCKEYKPKTEDSKAQHVFKNTLISNLSDLVDNLPLMNITNNKEINDLCVDIKHLLKGLDLETLREDDTIREQASKQAQSILEKMQGYGV